AREQRTKAAAAFIEGGNGLSCFHLTLGAISDRAVVECQYRPTEIVTRRPAACLKLRRLLVLQQRVRLGWIIVLELHLPAHGAGRCLKFDDGRAVVLIGANLKGASGDIGECT